jgi:hypothetical protein
MKKYLSVITLAVLLFSGLSVSAQNGNFKKKHPRRAEVIQREKNEKRKNADAAEDGKITKKQEAKLNRQDGRIRRQERADAEKNGGHITKGEQNQLNREENHVNAERNNMEKRDAEKPADQ